VRDHQSESFHEQQLSNYQLLPPPETSELTSGGEDGEWDGESKNDTRTQQQHTHTNDGIPHTPAHSLPVTVMPGEKSPSCPAVSPGAQCVMSVEN
jgi:hypothetical protein